MQLEQMGWDSFFSSSFAKFARQGCVPGRIACQHRGAYTAYVEQGVWKGELAGRLRFDAAGGELPAVGDWVAMEPRGNEEAGTIVAVLPRRTRFCRKAAGAAVREQVIAANVDILLLVCGLDARLNLRRLERYLAAAWDSGATPVVVLNKADACEDVAGAVAEVQSIAPGVAVHPLSALSGDGLEALRACMVSGRTTALLGCSGVGKTTLANALVGSADRATAPVHHHDGHAYGQHTTTRRELIPLPQGGMLMDTPGMREFAPWDEQADLGATFSDVEALAARCRFGDCRHDTEPGCAVRQALSDGRLDAGRYESYLKLQRELRHLASRQDQGLRLAEREKWKKIARMVRQIKRRKYGD